MTYSQAREILGSCAEWELDAMIRALTMLPLLNSPEENQRLKAAITIRKYIRKAKD